MDRMTYSEDTSHPSVPPLLPNKLMNKVAVVAGMEVMHSFSIMDFHSSELIKL